MADTYYPFLSDLITIDQLPDGLSFISDDLNSIFSKIRYQNFIAEHSINESTGFYQLNIFVFSALQLDIPGTGLVLILNPDLQSGVSQTIISINLNWRWNLLRYISGFNITQFASDGNAFFNLLINFFSGSDKDFLSSSLNTFMVPDEDPDAASNPDYDWDNTDDAPRQDDPEVPDETVEFDPDVYFENEPTINNDYLNNFVDDLVAKYPDFTISQPLDTDPDTACNEIIAAFDAAGMDIQSTISEMYVVDPTSLDNSLNNVGDLFFDTFGQDPIALGKQIIVPELTASSQLSAGLEIPRSVLLPLDANNVVIPGDVKTTLVLDVGNFYFSTNSGFGFDDVLTLSFSPATPKAQIANTGLSIGFTNAKLDTSTTTNIPEADAAGYPVDFVGLYVQTAIIGFNNFGDDDTDNVSASITGTNLLIGTGGVSGTITLADDGLLYRKFGEFGVALDRFSISFRQNSIVSSSISGELNLPANFNENGNPVTIAIDVSIKDSGDFSVTSTPQETFPVFTLPNVFQLSIRSLTIGEQNGRFFIAVAGTLDFIANIPVLGDVLPKGIIINKLIIWDNGDLEFEGGGIVVPKAFKLQVGPVKLEVTHLSHGSYPKELNGVPRAYYYFGFDGMVNTGAAGIDVAGNGIKYYFTHDNGPGMPFDNFISIDGISIDITIPGDASAADAIFVLQGSLSMKNPDPEIPDSNAGTEYTGKVSFSIPKLDLEGSAAMRLMPSVPAFLVDIGMELSTPIPLGGTGLGIYGFRGLIGQHYVPALSATTPPSSDWWQYYKAKSSITHQEGIEVDKFIDAPGYSIGAGVSIATDFDSGFTFSSKLFLLLGLPDVFVIQGQAAIIRSRLGLLDNVDPPFSAAIIITPQSFEGHLAVNYNLPDSGSFKGDVLSVIASLDLGFSFTDSSGWYLNLGKDTPDSARVQAKVLSLFSGYAYLMISSQGIKAGAGVAFSCNASFSGFGVQLNAHLDIGGSISFKPVQIGGYISVGGSINVKIFGINLLGFGINLTLAAEAPSPFNISGTVSVTVKLLFIHKTVNIELGWHFNDNNDTIQPVTVLGLPDPSSGYMPAVATNILTSERFPVNYVTIASPTGIPAPGAGGWAYNFLSATESENVTIPVDSYIDIELLKPVIPGNVPLGGADNQLPNGYIELIPPQKGITAQAKHQYEITELDIYAWNAVDNVWMPYNVYEAVTAIVSANTGPDAIDLSQLKPGYWQFTDKDTYNKIRLLSQNMFSYTNGSTNTALTLAARGFQNKDVFCHETIQKDNVVNWIEVTEGTVYPEDTAVYIQLLTFTFSGVTGTVQEEVSYGNPALMIDGDQGDLTISFPVPVANVKFEFGDNLNKLTVDFIQTAYLSSLSGQTLISYPVISTSQLLPGQQNAVVSYDNVDVAVDQVKLTFESVAIPDYDGDLIIGGHYQLAASFITGGLDANVELNRSLMFSTWYNQSFTQAQVLLMDYTGQGNVVAQWPLDTVHDNIGGLDAIPTGSLTDVSGFYEPDPQQDQQVHNVYSFTASADALVVPYNSILKIENNSFSFEITAIFDPFSKGIGTLFYKIKADSITGNKSGYALHLLQSTPAIAGAVYTTSVPVFTILLTCYQGTSSSGITITEPYTLDCDTMTVTAIQYKRIFVSVNREANKIELYINKILKYSADIPAELGVFTATDVYTYLNQITYITESDQQRITDNNITAAGLIDEIQILSDTINKTVQPVWRPNTIFAVKITTQDRVNGNAPAANATTRIFGFKTVGPLGHFHQQNPTYQQLAASDQAGAFKLASLQFYIDYNRSFPDAQGRYNLSKPVLYHNPQVKLFFTQSYVNAMYSNWDNYLGMPGLQSSLQLQIVDTAGNVLTQQLTLEPPQLTVIDNTNYTSLPTDQQILYLLSQASSQGGCNPLPAPLLKILQQGTYNFPDLLPNTLYTALFNALYQTDSVSTADSVEVYKFSFLSSRFATFQDQASSYILNATPGAEQYAIYKQPVSFSQDYIDQTLKPLTNDDPTDDPSSVLQYATKYDRLVYGGLQLAAPEPFNYSAVKLMINTDPADATNLKILGIIIYNPEPFNDPKLPAVSLANTIRMTITLPDTTVITPDQFINCHSADNSAVLITNAAMDIAVGSVQFGFRYKIFNGIDYETQYEDYNGPAIDITPYFQ